MEILKNYVKDSFDAQMLSIAMKEFVWEGDVSDDMIP